VDTKATRSASENAKDESGSGPTLGQVLTAAREKLGVSRQEAAQRAHLSLSYVEMLEGESYKRVSDQIYLVPFLRRYASALGLDGEDLAMRFVRDFQYMENESARMTAPVTLKSRRSNRRYSWLAIVIAAAAAIALAKFGQSYYREQSPGSSAHTRASSASTTSLRQPAPDSGQAARPDSQPPVAGQSVPSAAVSSSSMPVGMGSAAEAQRATASGAALAPARAAAPATPARSLSDSSANNEEDSAGTE
jgi:cytoskeleton protein RodZ